jgi:Fe-S-cluster-containing dehydrogenase component
MEVCSYWHFGICSLEKNHIKILEDPKKKAAFIGIHCAHCDTPLCMASCPAEAIKKDEKTGMVTIDNLKCIGCRTCIVACPVSNPWYDEVRKTVYKCDLCGGDPQCVKFCPTAAIQYIPREKARELVKLLGVK